jgi:hypothetical protein
LYNLQHMTMGRNWCIALLLDKPNHRKSNLVWQYLFCILYFVFVKASRWWGVTRSAQPHVHMYMFCPYVISNLYQFLEKCKWEISKILFSCNYSHNFTPEKWIKIPLLFITNVCHRALASCCSRKREQYSWHRNTSSWRVSSGKRPVDLPLSLATLLVKVQKEFCSSWLVLP